MDNDLFKFLGEYRQSLHYHEQELAISEGLGDDLGLGIACRKVGECLCAMEKFRDAIKHQKKHLEMATKIGECVESFAESFVHFLYFFVALRRSH